MNQGLFVPFGSEILSSGLFCGNGRMVGLSFTVLELSFVGLRSKQMLLADMGMHGGKMRGWGRVALNM